jgi:hypothetical protein
VKDEVAPVHAMKAYRRVEVWFHTFLNSELDGGEQSASRIGRVAPRGMSSRQPLTKRVGGLQSRSGRFGFVGLFQVENAG